MLTIDTSNDFFISKLMQYGVKYFRGKKGKKFSRNLIMSGQQMLTVSGQ